MHIFFMQHVSVQFKIFEKNGCLLLLHYEIVTLFIFDVFGTYLGTEKQYLIWLWGVALKSATWPHNPSG